MALEQQTYKAISMVKASSSALEEERRRHHQRLLKLESSGADYHQSHDEHREGLMHLHMRLEAIEALQNEPPKAMTSSQSVVAPAIADTNAEMVRLLELRVNESHDRIEKVLSDVHDLH